MGELMQKAKSRSSHVGNHSIGVAFVACAALLAPALAEAGTLRGVVTSAGVPVQGATVTVRSRTYHPAFGYVYSNPTTYTTGPGGAYETGALSSSSTFVAFASSSGTATTTSSGTLCYDPDTRYCGDEVAEAFAVPQTEGRVLDFALAPEAAVAGTVRRTSDGQGVAGARVRITIANGAVQEPELVATADANGRFRLGGLRDVTLRLVAEPPTAEASLMRQAYPAVDCGWLRGCNAQPLALVAGEVRNGVDFSLSAGATIVVRVVDDLTGRPRQASVTVWSADEPDRKTSIFTGFEGETRAHPGFAPIRIKASISDARFHPEMYADVPCGTTCDGDLATPIDLVAGQTRTLDFAVRSRRIFRGRVVDRTSGEPLAGIVVAMGHEQSPPFYETYQYKDFHAIDSATTDVAGRYVLTLSHDMLRTRDRNAFVDRAYPDVECNVRNSFCTSGTAGAIRPSALPEGEHVLADLRLDRAAYVSGTVHAPVGRLSDWPRLIVMDDDDSVARLLYLPSDGRYVVGGLPAGTVRLAADNAGRVELFERLACGAGAQAYFSASCPRASAVRIAVDPAAERTGVHFFVDLFQSSFE